MNKTCFHANVSQKRNLRRKKKIKKNSVKGGGVSYSAASALNSKQTQTYKQTNKNTHICTKPAKGWGNNLLTGGCKVDGIHLQLTKFHLSKQYSKFGHLKHYSPNRIDFLNVFTL